MSVQRSFELGGSIFKTAEGLRSLIVAASQDDVQGQAILAAEQLGSLFILSQDRIGEAVRKQWVEDTLLRISPSHYFLHLGPS